jgi:hypothetical protein
MAEERVTSSGWLPPVAPGSGAPEPAPPPQRPTFARAGPDRSGTRSQPTSSASSGNPQAVWALVLAIAALALLLVSLGTLFVLTLPCSIAAWWLAGQARRRLQTGETANGSGQAVAALWIARIGMIAGVAAAVVLIALLASGFDFEQFREDLERELEQRRERRGDGVRTSLQGLRAAVGR